MKQLVTTKSNSSYRICLFLYGCLMHHSAKHCSIMVILDNLSDQEQLAQDVAKAAITN